MIERQSGTRIVVIGGSGLIGSKLVDRLRRRGHEVIAASPASGVDTITGEGLADVLAGARIVVDVANSPSFEDRAALRFFETSGRNLLAAEAAAGVRHHVALSVVGTERLLESGYFRAKLAQEALIRASRIPYSILRATQFFEFVGAIAEAATQDGIARLSPAFIQPVASDDVAATLAEVTLAAPLDGTVELGGPDLFSLDECVRQLLAARGDTRQVVADVRARYFGVQLNDRSLVPGGDARIGGTRFADWLDQSVRREQHGQATVSAGAA
ncbi:MAG TPA: SDR family oxidoreductase [Geminicoccaceae bacterium]|nr:SDR family oxidoreductase [Geminicoccus sp.]HMU49051.1 SDR family oxidoreductase [Geminicoccaceae bacterium]